MKKSLITAAASSALGLSALTLSALPAFAHVVVTPNQVGVAKFQTFNIGVPSEEDKSKAPTVEVRLVMADGLKEVTPTLKPGWTVTTKKNGDDVTEIDWKGGSVPTGFRDDFTFSAQVPASAATLQWKAYQTYQDGVVVSWDQDPSTIASGQEGTPYSTTNVVNDLPQDTRSALQKFLDDEHTAVGVAIAALVFGLASLVWQLRKKA
jgi:uncharacterized protein YcnI